MGTLADTKGFKKPVFTISMETAMTVTFAVTAVWWIAMTILLLKTYRQKYYAEKKKNAVKDSFARLGNTFKNVKQNKKVFVFLLAFFFYTDGVYTIIDMATAYGQALGLDSTGLLMALLVTQIVAFGFVAGMVFFIYSLRVEPEKKEQREELIKSKLAVTEEY